jgi:hypothetical protein
MKDVCQFNLALEVYTEAFQVNLIYFMEDQLEHFQLSQNWFIA